jgi:hypothetical protein
MDTLSKIKKILLTELFDLQVGAYEGVYVMTLILLVLGIILFITGTQ